MKTKTIFLWLLLAMLVGGVNSAWADNTQAFDFTGSSATSIGDISITGGTYSNSDGGYYGIANGATYTIASSSGNIKTITVTYSSNSGNRVGGTVTASPAGGSGSGLTDKVGTWVGNASTVSFTTTNTARIKQISVVYSTNAVVNTWIFTSWSSGTITALEAEAAKTSGATWGKNENWYNYKGTPALNAEDLTANSVTLTETSGLKFTNEYGKDNRIAISNSTDNYYLYMNAAGITIPNIYKGNIVKMSLTAGTGQGNAITATNATPTNYNTGVSSRSSVSNYVANVTSDGDVYFFFASNAIYLYSIQVEKGDPLFEWNTDYPNVFTYGESGNKYFNLKITDYLIDTAEKIASNVTVTSSDESIVTIGTCYRGAENRLMIPINILKPGNAKIRCTLSETNGYKGHETIERNITINKGAQNISYPNSAVSVNYDGTVNNILTQTLVATGSTITYSSSNEHVATVNSDGTVIPHNAGTCTITATASATEYYNEASASYTLTVNATSTPTLAWSTEYGQTNPDVTSTVAYGNNFNCYCTNTGSETVQYSSANTEIATVEVVEGKSGGTTYKYCQITPVNVGTVTITAFVPSHQGEAAQSISFNLTITKGSIASQFNFVPNSGSVLVDHTIGPRLKFPTMLASDIKALTATSSDNTIATVTLANTSEYYAYQGDRVDGVYPIVTGVKAGKTATITVTFESDVYESATATYTVTVVDNLSWNWTEPSKEYTLYTEDYMKVPDITGNTTGNFQLSVGSYNASNNGYIYEIKKGVITYNNRDWHRGEGVPNYSIVTDGIASPGAAKIFWLAGRNVDGAALFVYAERAGDVKLRATDTQTGTYHDLTIHILNKTDYNTYTDNDNKDKAANNKNGATYGSSGNIHTTWTDTAVYPFTWDFTSNFTVTDNTNCYWIDNGNGTYSLGYPTALNYDYADTDNNGETSGNNAGKYKPIHLKQMEGMTIYLANNDGKWTNKENKVRILAAGTDSQGKARGRLNINGGTFKLTIPNDPNIAPATGYKLYVKVVGTSDDDSDLYLVVNGAWVGYKPSTTPQVYSADVSKGQSVELWLNNVDVYWIAFSTEAKALTKETWTNYPAASYSYGIDLDFNYTDEIYNSDLTPYYASSFGSSAVVLSPLRSRSGGDNSVPAGTGLILKGPSGGSAGSYHMVAKAKNMESEDYSTPTAFADISAETGVKNYLKSTGTSGTTITRFGSSCTNFVLANQYFEVSKDNPDDETQYGTTQNTEWSFVRVNRSIAAPANMAYLQVPGEEGNISTSSRSMSEQEGISSRAILGIVFEDEQSSLTNIHTLSGTKMSEDDAWYSLQGVRVSIPKKGGMYIHNGRKVIFK